MDQYLHAPIIPNEGAADIKLGESRRKALNILGIPINTVTLPSGVINMIFKSVEIWLEPNQTISQICVSQGYSGKSLEGIRIGMDKEDLKTLWGKDLAHHQDDDYWEFINRPGTLFEFITDEEGIMRVNKIYISE